MDILRWAPFTLGPKGPRLLHLFFTDELALISNATSNSIHTMYECMNYFCKLSGHKINANKFKVVYSNKCPDSIKILVKSLFDISSSNQFGKYLRFPILNHKPKCLDF